MVGKTVSFYEVLGVTKTSTDDEIKTAYRRLAIQYHPDHNPGNKKAEERFKEIAEAYEILSDPTKRTQYDKTGDVKAPVGPTIIKNKTKLYPVLTRIAGGDLSDIYQTGDGLVLKIGKDKNVTDLLENEAKVLKKIFPPEAKEEKMMRYLPHLKDSFKIDDGSGARVVNVFEELPNWYSIASIRASYPNGVKFEHGVWMFNRILEILSVIHKGEKTVHGAILPPHVLAFANDQERDPRNHGCKLIDWSYSVPIGEPLKAISPLYRAFYPPEVFDKGKATPGIDLYMAAKTIAYALGAEVTPNGMSFPPNVPRYLANFLKGTVIAAPSIRPQDAWALYEEFKESMAKNYGPKKYIRFDMPPRA